MANINHMVNGVNVSVNVQDIGEGKYLVTFLTPPGAGRGPIPVNGNSSEAIESQAADNGCTYTLVPIGTTWDEIDDRSQVEWLVQCTA